MTVPPRVVTGWERSVADGGGFEPPVPYKGTHAFQACTIDRSVTHPFTRLLDGRERILLENAAASSAMLRPVRIA